MSIESRVPLHTVVMLSDEYAHQTISIPGLYETSIRQQIMQLQTVVPTKGQYLDDTEWDLNYRPLLGHEEDDLETHAQHYSIVKHFGNHGSVVQMRWEVDMLDRLKVRWDHQTYNDRKDVFVHSMSFHPQKGQFLDTVNRYRVTNETGPEFPAWSTRDPAYNVMLGLISDIYRDIGSTLPPIVSNVMSLEDFIGMGSIAVWHTTEGTVPDPRDFRHLIVIDDGERNEIDVTPPIVPKVVYKVTIPRKFEKVCFTVSHYAEEKIKRPIINPSLLPGVCSAFDLRALSQHHETRILVFLQGGVVHYLVEVPLSTATNLLPPRHSAYQDLTTPLSPIFVYCESADSDTGILKIFHRNGVQAIVVELVVVVGDSRVIRDVESIAIIHPVYVLSGTCPHYPIRILGDTGYHMLTSQDVKYGGMSYSNMSDYCVIDIDYANPRHMQVLQEEYSADDSCSCESLDVTPVMFGWNEVIHEEGEDTEDFDDFE